MRRYDLDWLRVIVFGLLIFYHVGMFFVPWGWHIKNNEIYEWLRWPMLVINQWRLPILFVISGMGTYYALFKRSGGQFTIERLKRLGIPLIFGCLFIVPPQVYIERLAAGQFTGSYLQFWPIQSLQGVYPEGNFSWHHLWFLPYLLVYSVLLAPLFVYLRNHPENNFQKWLKKRLSHFWGLYLFIIPLYFCEALLEPFFPETHALIDDWFVLISSGLLFLFGFLLITAKGAFWETVTTLRRKYLLAAVVGFGLLTIRWIMFEDSVLVHFIEALVKVFNLWSWILALFGYAARYLNKPSAALAYCNQAVYPFYILHQSVTIVLAYWIMDSDLSLLIKGSYLIVGTFGVSWLIYEFLIRRIGIIRPLFGLKTTSVRLDEPSQMPTTLRRDQIS